MATRVKDLTTKELQSLISRSVKETMEDVMEDMLALSSRSFWKMIQRRRKQKTLSMDEMRKALNS